MVILKEKESIDITVKWLKNKKTGVSRVIDAKYFYDGKNKYYVDGKGVVLDYSIKEKDIPKWLANLFGETVYMLPRINYPEGIKTADYLFKGEHWDLKKINGNGKNVFFHAIEKHEKQAHNFIFDLSTSALTDLEINDRLNKLYKIPRLSWLNKIIIIRNNKVIKIIKRSNPSD